MKKEKIIAIIVGGSLISSTLLQPLAVYADNLNKRDKYSNSSINARVISNAPDFNITTNITPGKVFDPTNGFDMTFNMHTDIDTSKTVKKGDKIKIQLPPEALKEVIRQNQ